MKSPRNGHLQTDVPCTKKGDRSLACNYRLVSLTSVPCKLLEHIVCSSNIMTHLDEHKLLSDRQHAFQKKHSCETQLIIFINDWARILDKGGQVDTFILDFKKAFDTSPHELLECKLYGYGIGGTVSLITPGHPRIPQDTPGHSRTALFVYSIYYMSV